MDSLHLAIDMLGKMYPEIWKSIVSSLAIIGMVYLQFYDLPPDFKVTVKEILVCTIGLAALIFLWVNFYFSFKTYRKYQDTLVSMTEF